MAADPQRHMSVEEYLELDRNSLDVKYEYIDGVAYEVRNPQALAGGSAAHSWIAVNVVVLLQKRLHSGPCYIFNSDMRVKIGKTRYAFPDVSVSCAAEDLHEEGDTISSPRLIVEVLSPSTEAYDRGKKFAYYQQLPSLQEYVLVSSQRQTVEVFTREDDGWRYHLYRAGQTVSLTSINITCSINEFYERVNFPSNDIP
jgi:Uma2 family endonuclease